MDKNEWYYEFHIDNNIVAAYIHENGISFEETELCTPGYINANIDKLYWVAEATFKHYIHFKNWD